MNELGEEVIEVGLTVIWSSRDNAHVTDRCTLRAVALADAPANSKVPGTYSGNLATLRYDQVPDRGKRGIHYIGGKEHTRSRILYVSDI